MARRVASSFMSTSASVLVYVPGAIPAAKSPLWRLRSPKFFFARARSPKFFFARAERARTGSATPGYLRGHSGGNNIFRLLL